MTDMPELVINILKLVTNMLEPVAERLMLLLIKFNCALHAVASTYSQKTQCQTV